MDSPDIRVTEQPLEVRSARRTAIIAGMMAATVVGALLVGIHAAGKADAGGLLGFGGLAADLNLALHLLLVLGLTFGFYLARRGSIEAHRVNQTIWVMVNSVLVASIMLPSILGFKLKSVAELADPSIGLTWLHALLGGFTVIGGLWLVLQMNDILPRRWHIAWWRGLMRATLAGYWAVAVLGVVTYYYWYAA